MDDNAVARTGALLEELEELLTGSELPLGEDARLDLSRTERTGVPEVILAPGKGDRLAALVAGMVAAQGVALVSRLTEVEQDQLEAGATAQGWTFEPHGSAAAVFRPGHRPSPLDAEVHLFCAGTSDLAVLEEARMVVEWAGLRCRVFPDCGVAGLHRLRAPIRAARDSADAVVVAAGMDAALPSVVAGLLDVPAIGLPVSTGYGLGGRGLAALLGMLQSCAPGLAVVNIDNGIGAGAAAVRICRRAAVLRAASR
ncbi:MAG: nickel pincer cofactor biosynthesis protein LarB [Candidatus Dormibacteria bacterium]